MVISRETVDLFTSLGLPINVQNKHVAKNINHCLNPILFYFSKLFGLLQINHGTPIISKKKSSVSPCCNSASLFTFFLVLHITDRKSFD